MNRQHTNVPQTGRGVTFPVWCIVHGGRPAAARDVTPMTLTRQHIQDVLETIPHPTRRGGLVSSGAVVEVGVFAGSVRVVLGTPGLTPDQVRGLTETIERAVRGAGETAGEPVERVTLACVPRLKQCPTLASLLVFGRPSWVRGTGCFADLTTPGAPPGADASPAPEPTPELPTPEEPPGANDPPRFPPPSTTPSPGTSHDPAP
jgi:hypothetical protein